MSKRLIESKRFFIFAAAIVAAVLLAVCLVACDNPSLPSPSSPVPVYDMNLTFDGDREVTLQEEILYTNDTGDTLTTLAFHLYPNAFAEDAKNPPYFAADRENFYYNGESFGCIEISSVELNRKTSDFVTNGTDDEILEVACALSDGETATVSITATLTLPECNARFGITESTVNLTGFYPVLCMYEDGAWRTDGYTAAGDPFYSETSSFYVTANIPADYVVACSGEVTSNEVKDDFKCVEITAENVRDFAMFLSRDFACETTAVALPSGEVNVEYYHVSDDSAKDTTALAADALKVFSDTFGAYPYSSFKVVQAPVGAGGMEYGALVAIDPSVTDATEYARTVVHETAHQWWFGAVGSDQLNSPWLDEGLTEFSTAYYFLKKGEKTTYTELTTAAQTYYGVYARMPAEVGFNPVMNRHLSSYISNGEYVAVTYCKGLLLFDALLSLAGEAKFETALRNYFADNLFSVATEQNLADAFEQAGFDAKGIIESFVSGAAIVN